MTTSPAEIDLKDEFCRYYLDHFDFWLRCARGRRFRDPEAVVQEGFFRIVRSLRGRPPLDSLAAWANKIMTNLFTDQGRMKRRGREELMPSPAPDDAQPVEPDREEAEANHVIDVLKTATILRSVLNEMDADDRALLEDLAEPTRDGGSDVPRQTLSDRRRRAKERLAKKLREHGYEELANDIENRLPRRKGRAHKRGERP
jgi:DNA-directed RNA polymerase specialized sigma24 family protein